MPNEIKDIRTVDTTTYPYIFEKNVSVPLATGGVIRCNVYRPRGSEGEKYPVLATYGPYGKDVHYSNFHPSSYAEVHPSQQSSHSAWEVPDPLHWTARGYAVVRADEIGSGQSPGFLDAMSASTASSFFTLIEWAADQPWSTGKVGLLGISYLAATQWAVASLRPRGLAAIVPWEGFSDLYRDALRHGGILSDGGWRAIWDRQVGSNQYGLAGRASRSWGDDTLEGDLSPAELETNRVHVVDWAQGALFRDDARFASQQFRLEDITVPLLSVANWGGILLHLRGNVQGYMRAGSRHKFLRFIVGRHDLPFFYPECVALQESFLDAFVKGEDRDGWASGRVPAVEMVLRKGDVGYNDPVAEMQFPRRAEAGWPIARTRYTEMYLAPDGGMNWVKPDVAMPDKVSYQAVGNVEECSTSFTTPPFSEEVEITGHIVARLSVSVAAEPYAASPPTDIDIFVNLRHLSADGKEIFYTGTTGEAAPVTKGFLRVSMRKTDPAHPDHRPWLPYRGYLSTDRLPVLPNEVYTVDVEIWPSNVVVRKGERLVLDVGSCDLAGSGIFTHNDPEDRAESKLKGTNSIHFGPGCENYILLPVIPAS